MPDPIAIALLAIRLLAGILFFFQGYDKLFRLKTEGVLRAFGDVLAQKNISIAFSRICVFLSSWVEMLAGLLLVLGLFRDVALYMLTVDMICVALAFSILKPMWEMGYFFPRFLLIMVLLLLPREWDCFCLEKLF